MFEMNFLHQQIMVEQNFSDSCLNCQHAIDIIKSKCIEFIEKINNFTPHSLTSLEPNKLYALYQLLDDLAHLEIGNHLTELIFKDPEIQKMLPTIRLYYRLFYTIHETHLATDILNSENPWKTFRSFPLYPRYKILIMNQINAMQIRSTSRLAFIGCGPFPTSLILMSRLYGIKSIGLDLCSDAVQLSRKVIQHLKMEEDIKIIHGDETALKDLEWNMVLVAALAEPKDRIFRNLLRILKLRKQNIPVIYRTYSGMRRVLYQPVGPADIKGFKITKEIPPSRRVNNTIVFAELDNSR